MHKFGFMLLVLVALGLAGCGERPKEGDAPNTEQAVKAEDLPPELKDRQQAREKVFGKPGPMGPGPTPRG